LASVARCVLGIDTGGTKCDAIAVRDDGTVLGWGRYDISADTQLLSPRARNWGGVGRSHRSVAHAVRQAMEGVSCDHLHFAGLSTFVPALPEGITPQTCLHVHHFRESEAAFALAGLEHGLVVLAGTGAFVYGRTRGGAVAQLDGMGPMVGDYGSGFQIGNLAIRAGAKAQWHARHASSLGEAVREALRARSGSGGFFSVVEYMGGERDRAEIAMLAELVDAEARKGDAVAVGILRQAAGDIAETVRDLLDRLEIGQEPYAMVGIGSVATRCDLYWEHLCARVHDFAPLLTPVRPQLPPVIGMTLLGLRAIDPAGFPAARERLLAAAETMLPAFTRTTETSGNP
jgi:N-acetylglucosamine kinase-like BadF-type ATPase